MPHKHIPTVSGWVAVKKNISVVLESLRRTWSQNLLAGNIVFNVETGSGCQMFHDDVDIVIDTVGAGVCKTDIEFYNFKQVFRVCNECVWLLFSGASRRLWAKGHTGTKGATGHYGKQTSVLDRIVELHWTFCFILFLLFLSIRAEEELLAQWESSVPVEVQYVSSSSQ